MANFVNVYLAEAHGADDQFAIHSPLQKVQHINNTKNMKERVDANKELVNLWMDDIDDKNEFKRLMINDTAEGRFNFLIDNMKNEMHQAFVAMPERLYIIENYKVVYQGGIGPFYYDLNEVKQYLKTYSNKKW